MQAMIVTVVAYEGVCSTARTVAAVKRALPLDINALLAKVLP